MANRSRLTIAKPHIEAFFNNQQTKVYSTSDLQKILDRNRGYSEWRLATTTRAKEFIEYLINKSKLKKISIDFPTPIIRYIWGAESSELIYDIALSLKKDAYLSHYTAMFFFNLTEQIPKNIYVTYEQSLKSRGELTQESIDKAFEQPARLTNNVASYHNYKITLLNGKFTGKTGVIKSPGENGLDLAITNIERTLIDAAVRPQYSGGIFEVLKAYEKAKESVSVNKIKAYLKTMDFIYPYHQVIGFYLEKAGYSAKRLELLHENITYDFYLTHEIKEAAFSEKWRLYYPKTLD